MGWKLKITALAPQARLRIPQIAVLLGRLPGVNASTLEDGLKKPPVELPELKTEEDARKLMAALSKMGLMCQILESQERPVGFNLSQDPVKHDSTTPANSIESIEPIEAKENRKSIDFSNELRSDNNSNAQANSSMENAKSHSIDQPKSTFNNDNSKLQAKSEGSKIELSIPNVKNKISRFAHESEKQSETKSVTIKTKYSYKTLTAIAFVILISLVPVLLVLPRFSALINPTESEAPPIYQGFTEPNSQKSAQDSNQTTSQKSKQQQQAKKQISQAKELQQQAKLTPDVRKATALLQQATKLNPYDNEAWVMLAERFRRMGQSKEALECEMKARNNEETRKKLEEIARAFIKAPTRATIDTASIQYSMEDSTLSQQEFVQQGTALQDTLLQMHPTKDFELQNTSLDNQYLVIER